MVLRAGFGSELPLGKAFLNLDFLAGTIAGMGGLGSEEKPPATPEGAKIADNLRNAGEYFMASVSFLAQVRFSVGYKVFEHLGVFGGISYDYIRLLSDTSPRPREGSLVIGGDDGRNSHRLGIFGGIQF
jgi:hypothetical protein